MNIAVRDRILLHLSQEDHQADRFVVTATLTRPGIAEACAQHPPNVSRAMRGLLRDRYVSEHSRSIKGDDRRQKTWQLTDSGREFAAKRSDELAQIKILIRDAKGTLLEVESWEASKRLEADLSLLQVFMDPFLISQ